MKKPLLISASVILVFVAGHTLWNQVQTRLHDAVAQVTELRNAAPVIASASPPVPAVDLVPVPVDKSAASPIASGDATQLKYDADSWRAKKFLLERYYPGLQRETGFGLGDVDKLLHLRDSDEAELEKGLGVAKYQRWKEYEAKVQSADVVRKLGRSLSGDDQLREYQATMLYRTIFDEKRRRDEELRIRTYATPSDPRMRLDFEFGNLLIKEESDRRLLAAAKSFLSEQQLDALPDAVIDSNVAATRENLERIRARMEHRAAQ